MPIITLLLLLRRVEFLLFHNQTSTLLENEKGFLNLKIKQSKQATKKGEENENELDKLDCQYY